MRLVLVNHTKQALPRNFIRQWLRFMQSEFISRRVRGNGRLQRSEITLVFLGIAEAKKINQRFRKKNYATDVLSFTSEESGELGELILCLPVLKRQALEHDLSFQEELAYLLTHGLLHLLGYDHETSKSEALKMFRIQDRVFALGQRQFFKT